MFVLKRKIKNLKKTNCNFKENEEFTRIIRSMCVKHLVIPLHKLLEQEYYIVDFDL